ncbi:MAG TPA: hypothetical protein DGG94_14110 [Micromonosporaceae bacterium]|nr:hypothetical protein [Micromonosporaceae bacterium]HCU50911.1 hypothetical protein [Micromonosporaceae bacterium]
MSSPSFGLRLAQLRRRRGLSQQQLADLLCAAAGTSTISRNEISRWERGVRLPAQPWLGWLTKVLDAPIDKPAQSVSQSTPAGPLQAADRRWLVLRGRVRVLPGQAARPAVWVVSAID